MGSELLFQYLYRFGVHLFGKPGTLVAFSHLTCVLDAGGHVGTVSGATSSQLPPSCVYLYRRIHLPWGGKGRQWHTYKCARTLGVSYP